MTDGEQPEGDGTAREPHPVRRMKEFHSPVLDQLGPIDLSGEKVLWPEDVEAMLAGRRARLRRWVGWPRARVRDWRRGLVQRSQRATRGWSDGDLWSLDDHLCLHLGTLLAESARTTRTHPPDLTHEEWRRQLGEAGDRLLAYAPEDEQRVRDARAAVAWVADNLVDLWE